MQVFLVVAVILAIATMGSHFFHKTVEETRVKEDSELRSYATKAGECVKGVYLDNYSLYHLNNKPPYRLERGFVIHIARDRLYYGKERFGEVEYTPWGAPPHINALKKCVNHSNGSLYIKFKSVDPLAVNGATIPYLNFEVAYGPDERLKNLFNEYEFHRVPMDLAVYSIYEDGQKLLDYIGNILTNYAMSNSSDEKLKNSFAVQGGVIHRKKDSSGRSVSETSKNLVYLDGGAVSFFQSNKTLALMNNEPWSPGRNQQNIQNGASVNSCNSLIKTVDTNPSIRGLNMGGGKVCNGRFLKNYIPETNFCAEGYTDFTNFRQGQGVKVMACEIRDYTNWSDVLGGHGVSSLFYTPLDRERYAGLHEVIAFSKQSNQHHNVWLEAMTGKRFMSRYVGLNVEDYKNPFFSRDTDMPQRIPFDFLIDNSSQSLYSGTIAVDWDQSIATESRISYALPVLPDIFTDPNVKPYFLLKKNVSSGLILR